MLRLAALAAVLVACSSPPGHPDVASPWSESLPLPEARLEPGVTSVGQRMIVAGGFDPGLVITRDIDAYDALENAWHSIQQAPRPWTHANIAAVATTLYLLGGLEGATYQPRGEVYALDLEDPAAQWRALTPMPAGLERGASAVVVSPPHIFLLGGANATDSVATCLDYDLSHDTWTQLPDLPSPRSHAAGMRREDGTLIVAGGLATLAASSALDETWALPIGGTGWQPRAPMPTARGGCAYGEVLGQLVCAGGERDTEATDAVESYDPLGDTWTSLAPMPSPRAGTQGAVIGGRLFVPGGSGSLRFEPTDTVFVFSLLDALP